MRRVNGRRFDNRREACALVQRQSRYIHAEVRLCGRLYAVCAAPEIHCIQIHGQNLILAVCRFDLEGEMDFFQLAPNGLFGAQVRQFRQLLRDGACAFGQCAVFDVAAKRAQDSIDVNPSMLVKAQILRSQKRLTGVHRNFIQRYDVSVFRAAQFAHQFALRVIHRGRLRQRGQLGSIQLLPIRHVENDIKRCAGKQKKTDERRQNHHQHFFLFAHSVSLLDRLFFFSAQSSR